MEDLSLMRLKPRSDGSGAATQDNARCLVCCLLMDDKYMQEMVDK